MNKEELICWISSLEDMHVFYNSRIWRRKRKDILKRDHNECQTCKRLGRYSEATTVHHIKHLKENPALALTDGNLMSVCYDCHNVLHPEKAIHYRKKKQLNEEKW